MVYTVKSLKEILLKFRRTYNVTWMSRTMLSGWILLEQRFSRYIKDGLGDDSESLLGHSFA